MTRISFRVLCAMAALGCVGGCAPDDVSLEIVVHNLEGGSWEASGGAVDARGFCDAGVARWVSFIDVDGSELRIDEFLERLAVVQRAGPDWQEAIEYLLVTEYLCSDGSGSITLVEDQRDPATWEVVAGRGAYAGVTGSGSIVWDSAPIGDEPLPAWVPRQVFLRGELAFETGT